MNCAARPYDLVFVAGGYQLRTKPRFADAIRAANAGSLRDAGLPGADADRAPGGDGDRLSAAGDAGANLAACRQGDQPRRHRRAEASWPHRRELTRAGAGGALRLRDDEKNSSRCLGSPPCAICPILSVSKTRGSCKSPRRTSISTARWEFWERTTGSSPTPWRWTRPMRDEIRSVCGGYNGSWTWRIVGLVDRGVEPQGRSSASRPRQRPDAGREPKPRPRVEN